MGLTRYKDNNGEEFTAHYDRESAHLPLTNTFQNPHIWCEIYLRRDGIHAANYGIEMFGKEVRGNAYHETREGVVEQAMDALALAYNNYLLEKLGPEDPKTRRVKKTTDGRIVALEDIKKGESIDIPSLVISPPLNSMLAAKEAKDDYYQKLAKMMAQNMGWDWDIVTPKTRHNLIETAKLLTDTDRQKLIKEVADKMDEGRANQDQGS